ncbi:MAG: DUF4296 domain-containing protein [Flavobacteriaceae bacterium]|nr:DUF4296 domain-containing protein [Flavobacteriaceae bacterium]
MKKLIILFIGVSLTACTSKTIPKKPVDLIPKDTMVLLLTDLFIAKSAAIEKNLDNQKNLNYIPLVYNKYKIDSTRFNTSNRYYTTVFEEYEIIYLEVKEKLEKINATMQPASKDKNSSVKKNN